MLLSNEDTFSSVYSIKIVKYNDPNKKTSGAPNLTIIVDLNVISVVAM